MAIIYSYKVLCFYITLITFIAPYTATADEGLNELTFGKYYEPYEPNIEPNAPGYTLPLDISDIVNYGTVSSNLSLKGAEHLIRQNGFAIFKPRLISSEDDFLFIYEILRSHVDTPMFFTADTGLYLYHTQFDETLKDIEERLFIQDINALTIVLLNDSLQLHEQLQDDLKEAAWRNIGYLSVARSLLDPNASIPEIVDDMVVSELGKIEAHRCLATSDLFKYTEDYSQYVPRGHYTRSEQLKRYFKAMMWYGRMAFLLKGGPGELISEYDAKVQTLQAVLLATSLKNIQVGDRTGLQVWDRLYTVTAFYVGLADDLTPHDYLSALDRVFGSDFALNDLQNEDNLFALKTELALLPSPRIYGGTGNIVLDGPITEESLNNVLDKTKGMRLMGQRFIPDSYMFQHLIFPEVSGYIGDPTRLPFTIGSCDCRAYVRGLDVMAVLGSREALKILIDEGDTDYMYYWQQFGKLKDKFDVLSLTDWNVNLYWSWLYSLRALMHELPEGYPNFMRTEAWQRRQLHAALASWTELRHDTILHAKQTYLPSPKAPPTPPPGYMEPIPVFWGRLLSLTRMTSQGLDDLNVLTPEARQRLSRLEELLQRILGIVAKQLTNEDLSSEEHEFFKKLPYNLPSVVTEEWQCPSTTLVADVHTCTSEQLVVEEAVGTVDLIVVACPMPDGKSFLAAGPVLSYYEFKHPMSDRLTDEAWRQLLESPNKPERPKWYVPLMH